MLLLWSLAVKQLCQREKHKLESLPSKSSQSQCFPNSPDFQVTNRLALSFPCETTVLEPCKLLQNGKRLSFLLYGIGLLRVI